MIRKNLAGLIERADFAHLGLLMSKGFAASSLAERSDSDRAEHIHDIVRKGNAQIKNKSAYFSAYLNWKLVLEQLPDIESFGMSLSSTLFIGNSHDNALETNCNFHQVYGVPMIPGSSIRGMLRHYMLDLGVSEEQMLFLFGSEPGADTKADESAGKEGLHAGCLVFYDALWVPSNGQGPLCFDILTPHHGDYYIQQGKVPATDFDVPVPVPQLGVQGDFWFVFSCTHSAWRSIVKDLLLKALSEHGVGSKTSLGNGIFKLDSGLYKQQVEAEKAESLAVTRTFKVTGNRNRLIALNVEVDGEVKKSLEVDSQSAQRFVDSLGKSQKKKVSEKSLEVTAKIRESGGRFVLFDLELPPGQTPENS